MRNYCIMVFIIVISLGFLGLNQAISAQNIPNDSNLKFISWGNQNRLNLSSIESDVYLLKGGTGNETSGFVTQGLEYTGNFALIVLGEVEVSNSNHQISFVFTVEGQNSTGNRQKSYDIVLVNGRIDSGGWIEDRFYEGLNGYSAKLVNFGDIVQQKHDRYKSLKKITISADKNSSIGSLYFSIKFYDDKFIHSKIFEIGRH